MTALGFQFDANAIPYLEPQAPVWEGKVAMQISKTEQKPTAANDGSQMLVLTATCPVGHYKGQSNVIRLNLWNKNPQAVEIAQRELSSICHVSGRMQISDTDQLLGAMFVGVWKKETRSFRDPKTGQDRQIESCVISEYRFPSGQSIREALAGQPASDPFSPNEVAATSTAQPQSQPQSDPAAMAGPQPQAGPQPGFQPPTQQAGFVPPMAPGAFGAASAPNGASPGATGAFGTAQPPSSAAPGPGFAPPGTAQAPAGFGAAAPPSQGAGKPFVPPGAPQPGPGPWGQ